MSDLASPPKIEPIAPVIPPAAEEPIEAIAKLAGSAIFSYPKRVLINKLRPQPFQPLPRGSIHTMPKEFSIRKLSYDPPRPTNKPQRMGLANIGVEHPEIGPIRENCFWNQPNHTSLNSISLSNKDHKTSFNKIPNNLFPFWMRASGYHRGDIEIGCSNYFDLHRFSLGELCFSTIAFLQALYPAWRIRQKRLSLFNRVTNHNLRHYSKNRRGQWIVNLKTNLPWNIPKRVDHEVDVGRLQWNCLVELNPNVLVLEPNY